MRFYAQARDAFDTFGSGFYAFCADCDDEITADDPMFYEPDADVDDDGRAYDCSTYLCQSCGEARGYEPVSR